jgi:predicted transcriptional regulator
MEKATRSSQTTMRVERDVRDALKVVAARRRQTVAAVIHEALTRFLKQCKDAE